MMCGFSRYWLFSDEVPGLFIEKGWVHDGIDYSFTPPSVEEEEEEGDEDEEDDDYQQGKLEHVSCCFERVAEYQPCIVNASDRIS